MKKICLLILSVLMLSLIIACDDKPADESNWKLSLVAEGDIFTCLDVTTSPFEEAGIRTNVDKNAGTITFVKTTLDGTDTVDYYQFTPADGQMLKYYYVSAMGSGYYYYYDISAGEVSVIENLDREDVTESLKSMGRYDSANETVKDEYALLVSYFSENFGKTIDEAVK